MTDIDSYLTDAEDDVRSADRDVRDAIASVRRALDELERAIDAGHHAPAHASGGLFVTADTAKLTEAVLRRRFVLEHLAAVRRMIASGL